MKISIISTYGYPLFHKGMDTSEIGGTEVQLYFLAQELKKNNELSIIVSDYGQPLLEEKDGIVFVRAINLKKRIVNYIRAPFLFLSALHRSKSDVFIVSPAGPELYMVAIYCTVFSQSFIHRVAHESEVDGTLAKNSVLARFFLKYSLKKASAIVTQSSDQKELLTSTYSCESTIIPNAFPLETDEAKYKIDKSGLLWVGRCVPWKRPEMVFDVAETFPNIAITMICPGEGEYFEEILKKAKEFTNIRFIKSVPFFDIQDYYNRSKIFLSTSEKEGFPNTFLQACIGGTAIVSFEVDPDNFIQTNEIGFVTEGNVEYFKQKIDDLYRNEELLERCSLNAEGYIAKEHNLRETIQTWQSLINAV